MNEIWTLVKTYALHIAFTVAAFAVLTGENSVTDFADDPSVISELGVWAALLGPMAAIATSELAKLRAKLDAEAAKTDPDTP